MSRKHSQQEFQTYCINLISSTAATGHCCISSLVRTQWHLNFFYRNQPEQYEHDNFFCLLQTHLIVTYILQSLNDTLSINRKNPHCPFSCWYCSLLKAFYASFISSYRWHQLHFFPSIFVQYLSLDKSPHCTQVVPNFVIFTKALSFSAARTVTSAPPTRLCITALTRPAMQF